MRRFLFLVPLAVLVAGLAACAHAESHVDAPLSDRFGLQLVAAYDWTRGGWDEPYSVGGAATLRLSDRLSLRGSSRYVFNAETWRSSIEVAVPLIGK